MEQQKSELEFDPNRTAFNAPDADFGTFDAGIHGENGKLVYNTRTMVVQVPESGVPHYPIEIPDVFMQVDQPNIFTCSEPKVDGMHFSINKGCPAWNGCAIVKHFRNWRKPCNVIIQKGTKIDSVPCHTAYVGMSQTGRPTSQVHYLLDKWRILTQQTWIPERRMENGKRVEVRVEVPNLAPFYEEDKVGRFAEPEKPKKKMGRPKKIKVEENVGTD